MTPDSEKRLLIGVDSGDIASNSNIIPNANNAVNLGSSSYQWSSVYAQSYYYNGTEFSNKFVTANTQQVITGFKIFNTGSWIRTPRTIDQTTNPSSFITGNGIAIWDNANYWASIEPQWTTDRSFRFVFGLSGFSTSETRPWSALIMEVTPENQALNLSAVHSNANLGTTANKWKTLNGINPGALSLPSFSSSDPTMLVWIDLDTKNWLLDGTGNAVSIALDGYVYVSVTCGTDGYVVITEGQYSYPNCFYMSTGVHIAGTASALLPVRKGIGITIYCKGTSIFHARFFPMQGNV